MGTELALLTYSPTALDYYPCASVAEVISRMDEQSISFISCLGFGDDRTEVEALLRQFDLPPALAQDIIDDTSVEFEGETERYLYLEHAVPVYLNGDSAPSAVRVSFILGASYLILFEKSDAPIFTKTFRRILSGQSRAQRYGPDYMLYLLLRAAIVEHYQVTFLRLNTRLDELEDMVLANPAEEEAYQEILVAREELKPWNIPLLELEDFLEFVKDAESRLITEETTRFYTRFLYREVRDLLDSYARLRQWLKEIMELHMASVSRRANKVMQLLTVVATIFLPLTFITSLYGMNFTNMPELNQPWAYPAVLLVLLLIAGGSLLYMKRRGWF